MKDVDYIDYKEDVFVGYRHYDSHGVRPSYPFGYGLSYTSFEIEKIDVKSVKHGWEISVDVTNVGENPGRDVVQLYSFGNAEKKPAEPARQLRGFAKTSVLEPGETETVIIFMGDMDLAVFNQETSEWVLDKGNYGMAVTADSEDFGMSFGLNVKKDKRRAVSASMLPSTPAPDGRVFIDE